MPKTVNDQLLAQARRDPHYRGKQVIIIGGKIFAAGTGRQAIELFKRLTKTYPRQSPLITYIPKADSLVLWVP